MNGELVGILGSKLFWIFFFLAAYLLYTYSRVKDLRRRKVTEYEMLVILSRILDKSEFDIFQESSDKWEISGERVDRDFRIYLERGEIPFYVRDYIRNHRLLRFTGKETGSR